MKTPLVLFLPSGATLPARQGAGGSTAELPSLFPDNSTGEGAVCAGNCGWLTAPSSRRPR